MSGMAELFAGANFERTIQKYCEDQSWKLADLNERRAILQFTMESGRTQTLYIIKYDTTLEFSVPSALSYPSTDDVPHYVSTLLLQRNSQKKIGFWCIEEIQGKKTYSCMHNAEMNLLNSDYFGSVVSALIQECDEFEGTADQMMGE
jgi:hypothetical protein